MVFKSIDFANQIPPTSQSSVLLRQTFLRTMKPVFKQISTQTILTKRRKMSMRFTNQQVNSPTPPSFYQAAAYRSCFSVLLKGIKGKGHNPQVWIFLPARRIKSVFQILQILEKGGLHTHHSFGIRRLAANIGLAAIAVLVVDGNKCFLTTLLFG